MEITNELVQTAVHEVAKPVINIYRSLPKKRQSFVKISTLATFITTTLIASKIK